MSILLYIFISFYGISFCIFISEYFLKRFIFRIIICTVIIVKHYTIISSKKTPSLTISRLSFQTFISLCFFAIHRIGFLSAPTSQGLVPHKRQSTKPLWHPTYKGKCMTLFIIRLWQFFLFRDFFLGCGRWRCRRDRQLVSKACTALLHYYLLLSVCSSYDQPKLTQKWLLIYYIARKALGVIPLYVCLPCGDKVIS